ncbi:MAG: fimbrillin family protein [Bacteroidaceae bacterium]|nr:fimbrillin family protein [Bacteroidaceae bacterium]
MAMLAGCQQAEGIMNPSEELIMSIEASIGDAARSRYAGDTPNDVNFTNGDKIGLSVNGGTFYEWEYQNASWKRADGNIAYWDNKTNKHTFKAFYPFGKITSEGAIEMPELTGQDGTMTSVAARDFLIAQKDESYATASGVVSLTFNHVSSLITIKLKGEGDLVGATINQITITGNNILASSTYKFGETAPVTVAGDQLNTMTLEPNCTITAGTNKLFYFIFNSGTANLSDVNLTIAYTSGGKDYTATLNGLGGDDSKFISGEQHIFSLKIADGVLSISGNEIADWNVTENVEDIIINGVENSNNETY